MGDASGAFEITLFLVDGSGCENEPSTFCSTVGAAGVATGAALAADSATLRSSVASFACGSAVVGVYVSK